MKKKRADYKMASFPKSRRFMATARFTQWLKELIESSYGLYDSSAKLEKKVAGAT